jgi:intracellular multiplication protein IcmL
MARPASKGRPRSGAPQKSGAGAVNANLAELHRQHRLMARALMGAGAVIVILAIVIAVLATTGAKPVYFASTPDMKIMQLKPLDRPVMSKAGLSAWVTRTIATTLGLDFKHYRETLMQVENRYTTTAFNSLVRSLKSGGTLQVVREKRLDAGVSISKAPLLLSSWVHSGTRYWKFQFPLTVSFENSGGVVSTQHLMATVTVQRVPTTKHPIGVAIAQVVIGNDNRS